MTREEILAQIVTLEKEVVRLQVRLRDLYLQVREGLDDSDSDVVE